MVVVVLGPQVERRCRPVVIQRAVGRARRAIHGDEEGPVLVQRVARARVVAQRIRHPGTQPPPVQVQRPGLVAQPVNNGPRDGARHSAPATPPGARACKAWTPGRPGRCARPATASPAGTGPSVIRTPSPAVRSSSPPSSRRIGGTGQPPWSRRSRPSHGVSPSFGGSTIQDRGWRGTPPRRNSTRPRSSASRETRHSRPSPHSRRTPVRCVVHDRLARRIGRILHGPSLVQASIPCRRHRRAARAGGRSRQSDAMPRAGRLQEMRPARITPVWASKGPPGQERRQSAGHVPKRYSRCGLPLHQHGHGLGAGAACGWSWSPRSGTRVVSFSPAVSFCSMSRNTGRSSGSSGRQQTVHRPGSRRLQLRQQGAPRVRQPNRPAAACRPSQPDARQARPAPGCSAPCRPVERSRPSSRAAVIWSSSGRCCNSDSRPNCVVVTPSTPASSKKMDVAIWCARRIMKPGRRYKPSKGSTGRAAMPPRMRPAPPRQAGYRQTSDGY